MNKQEYLFDIGAVVRLVNVCHDWAYAERTGKEFVVKSRTHAACDNVYTIQATDGDGSAFFERNLILVKRKGK